MKSEETLCIHCAKACGGCNWSDRLEPVEGWQTIPDINRKGIKIGDQVVGCPEFVRGTRDDKRHKEFSENGICLLLEAMMKMLRNDYRFGDSVQRRSIESFLLSEQGKNMLQFSDPEAVISGLRRMIRVKR